MSAVARATVQECGDAAVLVVVRGGSADERWELVHGLAEELGDGPLAPVPTYDRLLVEFDPLQTTHRTVTDLVHRALAGLAPRGSREVREFEIPVVYGGEPGPDLDLVAEQQGRSPEEIVAIHSGAEYTVRCLGSPAGAPMMDGPPFPAPVPRLASPRPRVPAGAVAVAGRQAVVSAMPAPGGWAVLGRTPLRLLDLGAVPPAAYRPGDRIRFRAVGPDEFDRRSGEVLGWCRG